MSKGILGFGCSFMWGEGLYYYANLENIPISENHTYDSSEIRHSMLEYKNRYRFLRLVADYYDTWEYKDNESNGGTNIEEYYHSFYNKLINHDVKMTDFKLVIWQLTQPMRDNPLSNDYTLYLTEPKNHHGYEINAYNEYKFIEKNQIDRTLYFIDRRCEEFEKLGIKVVTIPWCSEFYENKIYQDKFMNRHVPLTFGNITVNAFDIIVMEDTDFDDKKKLNITVSSDFRDKGLQINDSHFNRRGHEFVAKSIIEKLNKDNFTKDEFLK